MRLAVLTTHPVQYFAPLFRELAKQPGLELKVFFGCDHGVKPRKDPNFGVVFQWDCQPITGFEHEFLSTAPLEGLHSIAGVRLANKAISAISHYKPDEVLIFSYLPSFITASTLLLRLTGHKLMLRAETTDEALTRSYWKDKLRQILLTFYYRQFTLFFPIGTNSINHYHRMGVDDSRLTLVPYAIDVDFFQKQVDYWLPQREYLRAAAGIKPQEYVLLYCGKMFQVKNPLLIPAALALLSLEEKAKIWLLAVGSGDLREQFESLSKEQLGTRASFVGFKNQSELGQYYAMADTLILPSQRGETWGLVVNEALQFGLRAIVSDKVGSGRDLITDARKGSIFSSGNTSALAEKISQLIVQSDSFSVNFSQLPHPKQLAQAIHHKKYDKKMVSLV